MKGGYTQFHSFLTSAPNECGWPDPCSVTLFTGKDSWYPFNRRMGQFQKNSGDNGEDRNVFILPGVQHTHEELVTFPKEIIF
jgi:hypothetical protein